MSRTRQRIAVITIAGVVLFTVCCFNRPAVTQESNGTSPFAPDPMAQGVAKPSKEPVSLATLKPGIWNLAVAEELAEEPAVSDFIGSAGAHISLDGHKKIEWYDRDRQMWEGIASIDLIEDRLAGVKLKNFVSISTGKAALDREEEYIKTIMKIAKKQGFEGMVVTRDSSSVLFVSEVIRFHEGYFEILQYSYD